MSMSLPDLAEKMKDIDFSMLFTRTESGAMAGRPMSNNADVEYDGDSYFYTFEDSETVHDISRDPTVALSLVGPKSLLGKPGLFIAVEGKADLIRDKAVLSQHWTKSLDRWFEQGVDTPGVVLVKVHAKRVHLLARRRKRGSQSKRLTSWLPRTNISRSMYVIKKREIVTASLPWIQRVKRCCLGYCCSVKPGRPWLSCPKGSGRTRA